MTEVRERKEGMEKERNRFGMVENGLGLLGKI